MQTEFRETDSDFERDPLVQALRALPQRRPGVDPWPGIAAALPDRLPAAGRLGWHRHSRLGWLIAAGLLLALLVPRWLVEPEPDLGAPTLATRVPETPTTAAWIAQSQRLEQLMQSPAMAPAAQDGDQWLIELGLAQHIGQIDMALADAPADAAPALWQARVGALAQWVELRSVGSALAWSDATGSQAAATMWAN